MKIRIILCLIGIFSQISSASAQKNICHDLNPGESMIVDESNEESPTGLRRKYVLSRDESLPNLFHVSVNINFQPTIFRGFEDRFRNNGKDFIPPSELNPDWATTDGFFFEMQSEKFGKLKASQFERERMIFGLSKDYQRAKFISKTKQCFRQFDGLLRSPDGKEIRLHYDQSAPLNLVTLEERQIRHNSGTWGYNIDCPTIIHEVLHLLGLVDGYRERTLGYQCRHLEPFSSIMHSTTAVLLSRVNVYKCKLSKNTVRPPIIVENVDEQFCEYNEFFSRHLNEKNLALIEWQNRDWEERGINSHFHAIRAGRPFRLTPAHMRLITKPFCSEENSSYLSCSANAYRSTEQGCIATPNFCNDFSYLD